MNTVTNNELRKITNTQFEKLQTQITQPPAIYQPQSQIIYQTSAVPILPSHPAQITLENPRLKVTQNWRSVMVVYQLILSFSQQPTGSRSWNSGISHTQNPNSQNYLSLLVIPEDATSNHSEFNQQSTLTNNILPATIIKDESLAMIFFFEIDELSEVLLFSRTALKEKSIIAMYTDVKIDGHTIKLILDSGSADSIITRQLIDQLSHRVD
ncbi:hypothetical protein G9A89_004200 [Geosiphon pyriformis]|nr:hypothetical protein G9A89_004200 [Geosiphon pyriformis]